MVNKWQGPGTRTGQLTHIGRVGVMETAIGELQPSSICQCGVALRILGWGRTCPRVPLGILPCTSVFRVPLWCGSQPWAWGPLTPKTSLSASLVGGGM